METVRLQEGVFLHIRRTKAFKENRIDLYFTKPLNETTRARCLLLSAMIPEAGENLHEKRKLISALDALYGARLSIRTFTVGANNCLLISLSALQKTYVQEEILLPQWQLLARLLNPSFSQRQLDEAKQQAFFNTMEEREDPDANSRQEVLRLCPDAVRFKANPTLESYETVSLADIQNEFTDLLQQGRIDICAIIDTDPDKFLSILNRTVSFTPRQGAVIAPAAGKTMCKRTRQVRRKSLQSALAQLYDTGIVLSDARMPALMLANGILGALPTSLLFQEVRERNSLCYAIDSELYLYDGLLQVTAQMRPANRAAVADLIRKQIARVQQGDFPDTLLSEAKKIYADNERGARDSLDVCSREMLIEALLNKPALHTRIQRAFSRISRKDIMLASTAWRCRANFVQQGKEV